MDLGLQVKDRVVDAFKPRTALDAQNAWNLYADIAWFGVLSGVASSFLSVFVIRVGGTDTHVGLLTALPALFTILAALPGSRLIESESKPPSVLITTLTLSRLGYLVIALIPFFLSTHSADAIVTLVGLLTIPGAIGTVAFTTLFGHAVKPEDRAHVVGVRYVCAGITSTAIAFAGGKFLDLVLFPINYQILFAIGFAASMMSVYYVARIKLPQGAVARSRPSEGELKAAGLMEMLRGSREYTSFTLYSFIFHWGMFFPLPLYSIYWVRVLNATEGWVGVLNMVGSATTIVFYPLWSRLTTRHGNLYVIVLSAVGLALYPLTTALSPAIEWILLVSFLGGVFSAGYAIAFFNRLLETSPELRRPSYIAWYNTAINIAAFVSPLVSASLTSVFSVHWLLIVGAGLRFLGAALFWRQYKQSVR